MSHYPLLIVFSVTYAIAGAAFAVYFAIGRNAVGVISFVVLAFAGVVMLRWSLIGWTADRRHRAIQAEPDHDG
jgi:hypothetical protein